MRHTRVVVPRYGGPEVITTIEEDIPPPAAGEVRVKVLAAGVSLPDILAREGVHPETPRVPYTPGWDLVGTVDQLGAGVTGFELGQKIAAMPIHGCYAQYVCVPQRKLVLVPERLDPAEAVAVVLNYVTAYQMLHRSVKVRPGQRMLIHGASGGVGSAMLQLAKLAGVEMYGKSMVPYSIQWFMRFRPAWFRRDLLTLLDLLKQGQIKPLIAQRLSLEAARSAHEMLGKGGILGKIVLLPNG
jgi:NADPH2:quinone reductase